MCEPFARQPAPLLLGLLLLGLGFTSLGWGFWPLPQRTHTLVFTPAQMQLLGMEGVQLGGRRLTLTYPVVLRLGDPGQARLVFEPQPLGTPAAGAAPNRGGNPGGLAGATGVTVETRLELPGLAVAPAGVSGQALPQDRAVTFWWEIAAQEAGDYEGTAWLSLRLTPESHGLDTELQPQALAAPRVTVRITHLAGLSGPAARWGGAAAAAAGLLISGWSWRHA
jgi:hypothetical protein